MIDALGPVRKFVTPGLLKWIPPETHPCRVARPRRRRRRRHGPGEHSRRSRHVQPRWDLAELSLRRTSISGQVIRSTPLQRTESALLNVLAIVLVPLIFPLRLGSLTARYKIRPRMSASIRWDPVGQSQELISTLADPTLLHILIEHGRRRRLVQRRPGVTARCVHGRGLRPRNRIRKRIALVRAGQHLVPGSIVVTHVLAAGALLDVGTSEVAALGAGVVGCRATAWFVALRQSVTFSSEQICIHTTSSLMRHLLHATPLSVVNGCGASGARLGSRLTGCAPSHWPTLRSHSPCRYFWHSFFFIDNGRLAIVVVVVVVVLCVRVCVCVCVCVCMCGLDWVLR